MKHAASGTNKHQAIDMPDLYNPRSVQHDQRQSCQRNCPIGHQHDDAPVPAID
jgi:hypothetical protein